MNTQVERKRCRACGSIKEATEENFERSDLSESGLSSWCILCIGERINSNSKRPQKKESDGDETTPDFDWFGTGFGIY